MTEHWIIGDVHGCLDELELLLRQLPDSATKYCVGDLIDRGPRSAGVVARVQADGILCVRGNHEQMAIDCQSLSGYQTWIYNGGRATENSYEDSYGDDAEDMLAEDRLWMARLPLALDICPDIQNDRGKVARVSHSIVNNGLQSLNPRDPEGVLWSRAFPARVDYDTPVYQIFGHTPQLREPLIRADWACIDGGCCYGYSLYAVRWPDMKVVRVPAIKGVRK